MFKKTLAFLLAALLLSSQAGAFAEGSWLSLGNAAVDAMFTQRDFDPSYESAVDIILADGASTVKGNGASVDRDVVTITQEGVYRLTGTLSNGQLVIYAPEAAKVQLVLDGVSISNEGGAAIHVARCDKAFISTASGSDNSLSSIGGFRDKDVDGAVFSKNDICFNGEGALTISSEAGHGIATKDDLKITSGSYTINAAKHGLSGKDSIRIGGGEVYISAGSDGLHSEHDKADKGYIFISGGNLDIVSEKDGIDCTNYLEILGGSISIDAASDGINAARPDDRDTSAYVSIGGGEVCIKAQEDGIDSNGSIGVHGGEVYISAAPRGGDGALDYASTAELNGGIVAAASAREMAANFSAADLQGSMLCSFSRPHSAGEEIILCDAEGNVLMSFAPMQDYQAVVLSCADVAAGGTYSVTAGDESIEITMDESLYGGFGFMGGPGGMTPPGMPEGMDRPEKPGLFGKKPKIF